ncbi:MAG: hypothetical protein K8S23_16985 [Candidatus Cloacimonetes bacterium]|nr:hypothetical protein [Candidatus Cloacimonadota bacterium]
MFLVNLKNMEERKAFCNLAVAIINIDGKQETEEIIYLQNAIKEMIINNDIAYDDIEVFSNELLGYVSKEKLNQEDIDRNLAIFFPASNLIKKTVLFELITLSNIDLELAKSEKKMIDYVAEKLGFSNKLVTEMQSAVTSLNDAFINAEKLVQD